MEPIVHKHNMGPIEALSVAGAQAYGSLDSKLNRHVSDNNRHVTNAERNSWNNKVDKTAYTETIAALERKVREINNTINNHSESEDNDSVVTKAYLQTELLDYVSLTAFDEDEDENDAIRRYVQRRARAIAESLGISEDPNDSIYATKGELNSLLTINQGDDGDYELVINYV